jgi:rhomboid protease GluP
MLPPHWRWKLNRYRERLRGVLQQTFRQEPKPRVCFNCGRLVGALEKACSSCGTSQSAVSFSVFKRLSLSVIPDQNPVTYALLFANLLFLIVAWLITVQGGGEPGGLFNQLDNRVLFLLGAKHGGRIFYLHEYWRLVMPIFLHGGVIHFGFNSFVLWQVGPQAEELFGSARFLFLYLATGVLGFLASALWYPLVVISVGSSGSIFGLIGVLIGYITQRSGFASEYRTSLVRWAIYIFIIGLFLGADNAAHLGGLVSGLVLGRLVSARRPVTAAARFRVGLMGWGSALVILWSVVMVLLNLPAAPAS